MVAASHILGPSEQRHCHGSQQSPSCQQLYSCVTTEGITEESQGESRPAKPRGIFHDNCLSIKHRILACPRSFPSTAIIIVCLPCQSLFPQPQSYEIWREWPNQSLRTPWTCLNVTMENRSGYGWWGITWFPYTFLGHWYREDSLGPPLTHLTWLWGFKWLY